MFNSLLYNSPGVRKNNHVGQVGVEIELENYIPPQTMNRLKNWVVTPDGSLRNNGVEFVLSAPVEISGLRQVMDDLEEYLGSSKENLSTSIRTSTHIHVNTRTFTVMGMYNILTAYWLLETCLVRLNGENREGNLFCLRVSDAESLFNQILIGLRDESYFQNVTSDRWRYSALNLASLSRFGSIEFRFIKGLKDFSEVKLWAETLWGMSNSAATGFDNPNQIIDLFMLDKDTILEAFLPPEIVSRIKRNPSYYLEMDENFSYAVNLSQEISKVSRMVERKNKFIRPFILSTHEDLDSRQTRTKNIRDMVEGDSEAPRVGTLPDWTAIIPDGILTQELVNMTNMPRR